MGTLYSQRPLVFSNHREHPSTSTNFKTKGIDFLQGHHVIGSTIMATVCIIPEKATPFLNELKSLYREMDRAYHVAAAKYGFECHGCTDNCCMTRFYHHTFVEYAYLKSGFLLLPQDTISQLTDRARQVTATYDGQENTEKIMCPLNQDGLCMVYDYRPMICRLHGIPNEMRRPDGVTLRGPGCPEFNRLYEQKPYVQT